MKTNFEKFFELKKPERQKQATESFSFRVEVDLLERFKALCEKADINAREGLRQLVEAYVKANPD